MSLPYFPLFPSDVEAETSHLSLEEDGAYNRLLRLCWMTPGCSIPAKPDWLRRRLRVDEATYTRVVRPILLEFFKWENGRIWNEHLSNRHVEISEKHRNRVEAGRKGGKARALKLHNSGLSNA
jgi:uncharacterized protein YdaU (DUF1376 family)